MMMVNNKNPNLKIGQKVFNGVSGNGDCTGRYGGGFELSLDSNKKQVWDFYVAPENLTNSDGNTFLGTYSEAIETLKAHFNWHGRGGDRTAGYSDSDFYDKLWREKYNNGWIIAPNEIMSGYGAAQGQKNQDNVYSHRKKLRVNENLKYPQDLSYIDDGPLYRDSLWTCTVNPKNYQERLGIPFKKVSAGKASKGRGTFEISNEVKMRVLPVRLELRETIPANE